MMKIFRKVYWKWCWGNRKDDVNWTLKSILVFSLIVILWNCSLSIFDLFFGANTKVSFSFESINALFAGLAFAGVIITMLMQREELKLQRQELAETRRELKRSADAQTKSEEALRNQILTMQTASKIETYLALSKTDAMKIARDHDIFKFQEIDSRKASFYTNKFIPERLRELIYLIDQERIEEYKNTEMQSKS